MVTELIILQLQNIVVCKLIGTELTKKGQTFWFSFGLNNCKYNSRHSEYYKYSTLKKYHYIIHVPKLIILIWLQ